MSVTNYTIEKCKYIRSKLKDVLYLVSEEHIKNIHIDGDEVYIDGLTELPLRINGFNILLNEETSLDERYKFQKTLTLSMNGYVNYKIFGGRYYAIVEDIEGVFYMINVDFPSRITHTFNLSKDTNQTDFTFASLSNFPTMKLNAEFEAVEPVCLGLRVNGIEKLELLEREKAVLDTENKKVISTEDFKVVEFLGNSCTFQEVYDGFKVTDTITFELPLNNKLQWEWHLLEFLDNRYASIITPKGGDNKYYPGFNFGLQPNYTIQTASQNGQSDIITVTLVEMSSYGTTAANDWSDDQDTETRWRWVKKVGDVICYECIGLGRARYLVKQKVDIFGNPTGDYQVMEGYDSQYPMFNIVGNFDEQNEFDTNDCGDESSCTITSNIPSSVVFTSTTCNTYSLSTTCDWQITDIPSHITVSPISGVANSSYTVTICNTMTPTTTPVERNISLKCCRNIRLINTKVMQGSTCLKPSIKQINCLGQTVAFTYNGECQIQVLSADGLTYQVGYNTLTVNVPRNTTTSAITWTLTYKNCECSADEGTVSIIQDKQYERWIEDSGYICDSGNSYHVEVKYTGTTSGDINTRTSETRKGSLIQSGDTRCGSETKYEWDGKYYCIDGDKYKALEEFALINGSWVKTGRTMLGEMVESASTWCESSVTYSWSSTTQTECSGTTSYYKYQKYVKIGEQDWLPYYPNTWSIDGEGTMPLNKKQDNDPNCGYVPQPEYDWENMDISTNYYCLECGSDAYKISGRYGSGDTEFHVNCDSSTTLSNNDIYTYDGITYAKIGACVTEIAGDTFFMYRGLSGVSMPNTVTTIGEGAFRECTALYDCILPQSVTTIGDYAFDNCISLSNFLLWNNVTSIGKYAFRDCDSLISVNIPTGITSIQEGCFMDCGALSEITIPGNVTSIGTSAFTRCRGIMTCTMNSGVLSIGDFSFHDCSSMVRLTLPNSLTTIGNYSFRNCGSLSSLTIPDSVVTIGRNAFDKCSGITSLSIGNSVTDIGMYAFGDCNHIPSITIPDSVVTIGYGAFSGCSRANSLTIGSGTTTIGGAAFYKCNSLTSLVIPDSVTTIEDSFAFGDCSGLTSVTFGSGLTYIGDDAFDNCSGITSLDIPNSVSGIGAFAFSDCVGLRNLNLPSGLTSIGSGMCYNCFLLRSVDIPSGVTSIGNAAFLRCGLTSVEIPSGVTYIGQQAFYLCNSLTSATINAITPPTLYGDHEFGGVGDTYPLYVPSGSVNSYKSAWPQYSDRIQAITT